MTNTYISLHRMSVWN